MDARRLQSGCAATADAHDLAGSCAYENDRLPVRGFLFEAPGVFYDDTLWRRWLLRLLARTGFRLRYDVFLDVWDSRYVPGIHCGDDDLSESLESFLDSVGLPPALIDEVMAAWRARWKEFEADQRPLPGVSQVLRRLQAEEYTVAVTAECEWTAAQMSDKLQRLGLDGNFDLVTTSVDLRCTKPDQVSFLGPAFRLNLVAGHVAFVGTRPDHIHGAKRAGMTTIALNCVEPCDADWHIKCLSQLPELSPWSSAACL